MSGSLLVVPGELSKASVLSNKKRKLLKPIEGIDQDKLTPKKQLQDWIKTYNKKGALDAFLDQSMSPSSRNSKRMAVNQSVDQCYFNPGVGQIVLNSSGPILRETSHDTEDSKKKQSQMSAALPEGMSSNIMSGNFDALEHFKQ